MTLLKKLIIYNSIFYNFIWNGKDKVKRCALTSDIDKGGLKMLDIKSMVSARRVICLKKFLEDYPSTWKSILNSFIFTCWWESSSALQL